VDECKGRRLFEMDCDRLRRINGMIAVLHGPSLDDGVCMEIGFAAARGVPVVLLTTDFQSYGPRADGPIFAFPEPSPEILAARLERAYRLAPPSGLPDPDRFSAFSQRNVQSLEAVIDQAVEALLGADASHAPAHATGRHAFLEPSPYLADETWEEVARLLEAEGWASTSRHGCAKTPTRTRRPGPTGMPSAGQVSPSWMSAGPRPRRVRPSWWVHLPRSGGPCWPIARLGGIPSRTDENRTGAT
jgi:hypothetical protein